MNRKRIVLYTRNLNEADHLRQAINMLQQIPGVSDVRDDESDTIGRSRPLATRLMVEYDTAETAPNSLAGELNSMGFQVEMQEEPDDDVMHNHPSRGLRADIYAYSSFNPPPPANDDTEYRTNY